MSFDYDIFVSYRWIEPDQSWVRNELVPALCSAGLKVCLDVEDFVPGRDLILEMSRAEKQSRRAICVLSPDYFEGDRMVGFESLMARRRNPSGDESHLIPFVLRPCTVPDWLRGLIPVDWTISRNHGREWRKLLKVLGAQKLDAKAPGPVVGELQDDKEPRTAQAPREMDLDPVTARAALDKAFKLASLNLNKEAIAVYDDLIARFSTASEFPIRECVAEALCNKGYMLIKLNLNEDAIIVFNDLLVRFGTATELPLRKQVARALDHKGAALMRLVRYVDAIIVFNHCWPGLAPQPSCRCANSSLVHLSKRGWRSARSPIRRKCTLGI
jgi:tetratricopeptide (TPR) repeat protein